MRRSNRTTLVLLLAVLLPLAASACGKAIGETLNDATITTRVKTALLNDPDIGVLRIDVTTNLGVVTLSGTVSATAEADRAVQIARGVQGVQGVKSAIKISGTA